MITVLLVDVHTLYRKILKKQIDLESDLQVVGEAENEPATLELTRLLAPDVILLDLDISGKDGLETIRDLKAILPHIPIILLSLSDNEALRKAAGKVGAADLIAKEVGPRVLFNAIRRAAAARNMKSTLQPGP